MLSAITMLIAASASASSVQQEPESLLAQLQHSFKTLNYELSYIKIEPSLGKVEPFRLIHTSVEDEEVIHLIYLNGPAREMVRKGSRVAYYEPDQLAYSVSSSRLPIMLEALSHISIPDLLNHYDLVIAGKSRAAGRAAQVMRIVPKQDDVYGLYIWFDYTTGLPLRIDTVDKEGELVEQMMAVSLLVYDEPSAWMKELATLQLPDLVGGGDIATAQSLDRGWRLSWLPAGMQEVSQDQHTLALLEEKVDYLRLTDGIFDISVYVNRIEESSSFSEEIAHHGATSLYTLVRDGREVTVVGEVPQQTVAAIAQGIEFSQVSSDR